MTNERQAELMASAVRAGCIAIQTVRTVYTMDGRGFHADGGERRADEEAVAKFVEAVTAMTAENFRVIVRQEIEDALGRLGLSDRSHD